MCCALYIIYIFHCVCVSYLYATPIAFDMRPLSHLYAAYIPLCTYNLYSIHHLDAIYCLYATCCLHASYVLPLCCAHCNFIYYQYLQCVILSAEYHAPCWSVKQERWAGMEEQEWKQCWAIPVPRIVSIPAPGSFMLTLSNLLRARCHFCSTGTGSARITYVINTLNIWFSSFCNIQCCGYFWYVRKIKCLSSHWFSLWSEPAICPWFEQLFVQG